MGETRKDFLEVLEWSDDEIHARLGEVTLNLADIPVPSGERLAADKEIDCLTFELHCREADNG